MSVLNVDYNILTTILAGRLSQLIGGYIGQDQTGFLPGRYLKDDIRKVLNVVNKAQQRTVPTKLLYLDAEKAFDKIQWEIYIFSNKKIWER